jgi:hypothetical protein
MTFWRGENATQNVFIVYMHDIAVLTKVIGGSALLNKSLYIVQAYRAIFVKYMNRIVRI